MKRTIFKASTQHSCHQHCQEKPDNGCKKHTAHPLIKRDSQDLTLEFICSYFFLAYYTCVYLASQPHGESEGREDEKQ